MEERSDVLSAINFDGNVQKPHSVPRGAGGFTIIELMIVVGIVGILSAIAVPSYQKYLLKSKEATAISDINTIAWKLKAIMMDDPTALPASLAQINFANTLPLIDPWGNPYQYFIIYGHLDDMTYLNGARKKGINKPITEDFDLYSMGPDGVTQKSLSANASRDDIVRADEGAFVGKASVYLP